MDDFHSLAGRLLVAMPGISDPRFEHAVILVCAHRPDHALGLRLDRPAPGIDLKAMVDPAMGPRRSVLLLGYAGWGEGQLEDELGENVWLTADADAELIFDPDYEGKWGKALAGLGVDPAQLSGQSGRA